MILSEMNKLLPWWHQHGHLCPWKMPWLHLLILHIKLFDVLKCMLKICFLDKFKCVFFETTAMLCSAVIKECEYRFLKMRSGIFNGLLSTRRTVVGQVETQAPQQPIPGFALLKGFLSCFCLPASTFMAFLIPSGCWFVLHSILSGRPFSLKNALYPRLMAFYHSDMIQEMLAKLAWVLSIISRPLFFCSFNLCATFSCSIEKNKLNACSTLLGWRATLLCILVALDCFVVFVV